MHSEYLFQENLPGFFPGGSKVGQLLGDEGLWPRSELRRRSAESVSAPENLALYPRILKASSRRMALFFECQADTKE